MGKESAFRPRPERPSDTAEEIRERVGFDLGENELGYEYIKENFFKSLYVLFRSLEGSEELRGRLRRYVVGKNEDGTLVRDRYTLDAKRDEGNLTPLEEDYYRSVEKLSRTNPYAAALLSEAFGETDDFVENHLESLSNSTWERIKSKDYIPALQIGAGVNGIAYFGQTARIDPALAAETLVVDAAPRVGGIFAAPHGPAWDMNSRTMIGPDKLPDYDPNLNISARAYTPNSVSPGERNDGDPLRGGSINKPSGHLIAPEAFSNKDYITNEDEAVLAGTLGATLFRNLSLETRVVSIEPNTTRRRGLSIVTLERSFPDGTAEQKQIFTDRIIYATGLGTPDYGFPIRPDGLAKDVLERQDPNAFPLISTSLEAFEKMADRRREPLRPPKTIVIGGSKDSARTMIEFLARQFEEGADVVSNVQKIYLISETQITDKLRPRYQKLLNVLARQNRKDVVEFVQARVDDIGFTGGALAGEPGKPLIFYGGDKRPIRRSNGAPITADAYIACTGFKRSTAELASYLEGGDLTDAVERVYLPNNPEVPVASRLRSAPHIQFVGVADPLGVSQEEIELLPRGTRDVLERIGENVVAIGVNAPRAAAAAAAVLDERKFVAPKGYVPLAARGEAPPMVPVLGSRDLEAAPGIVVPFNAELLKRERPAGHVRYTEDLVSALFAYELRKFKFTGAPEEDIPVEISLYPGNVPALSIRLSTPESFSGEFAQAIERIFENKRIQVYAYSLLRDRRATRDKTLSLTLRMRGGTVEATRADTLSEAA